MNALFKTLAIVAFAACAVLGYYAWQLNSNLAEYEAENKNLKDQTENLETEMDDLLTRLDNFQVPEEPATTQSKPKQTSAPKKSTPKATTSKKKASTTASTTPKSAEPAQSSGPAEYGVYQPSNRPSGAIPKSAETTATRLSQSQNAAAVSLGGVVYHTYLVDLSQAAINLYFANPANGNQFSSINNLVQYLNGRAETLLFATNGGMFDDFGQPLGLYVQDGREIAPINLNQGVGNFYMEPNGVFYTTRFQTMGIATSNNYNSISQYVTDATQSGPMLVTNGRINPNFQPGSTNRTQRSGVGMIDDNRAIFVISNNPVNFYDFAAFFKEYYGCNNALYLDGGISQMYIPDLGRNQVGGEFGVMIGVTQVFN